MNHRSAHRAIGLSNPCHEESDRILGRGWVRTLRSAVAAIAFAGVLLPGTVAFAQGRPGAGTPPHTTAAGAPAAAHSWLTMSDRLRARATPAQRTAAVRTHGLQRAALRNDYVRNHTTQYAHEVPHEVLADHIQNQQSTGRCWIFATLNIMSNAHFSRTGRPVRLSQSYVNHFAWLHRAEETLQEIEGSVRPVDLGSLGEGGNFQPASELIMQHGVVPQDAMPDTPDGANTGVMIDRIRQVLAAAQHEVREVPRTRETAPLRIAVYQRAMRQVREVLNMSLGEPPATVRLADGREISPQQYAQQELAFDPKDYVVLFHDSSEGMAYNQINGRSRIPTMTASQRMMRASLKNSIDQRQAVYFASAVGGDNPFIVPNRGDGSYPREARGVMSIRAFDYDSLLDLGELPKRTMSEAGLNGMNHAMAFTGYNENGRHEITQLKVDNSWGTDAADHGHQHMDTDFFDRYVKMIVVPRSALPDTLRRGLERGELRQAAQDAREQRAIARMARRLAPRPGDPQPVAAPVAAPVTEPAVVPGANIHLHNVDED